MGFRFRSGHSLSRRSFLLGAVLGPDIESARADTTAQHAALLDELERRACLFFYEQAHPVTGLVLDRVRVDGVDDRRVASIAATGFGLSALCIAHQRDFLKHDQAEERVERTLDFLARRAFRQKGFYFHFLDCVTGERAFECELSSVDTAWLLCGVLHAREHFDKGKIRRLANEILGRVNWTWMLADGDTLCHGWTPENGFLPYRWDEYSEILAMYLLAIGSTTYPIRASSWDAWTRPHRIAESGELFIESRAPLFVHQYSHAWLDFRNKQDGWADYFLNSREATIRHREFCIGLKDRFPWFGEDMWGISSSDSRYGYLDWGGTRTQANSKIDGTLVPCASGGSIVFLPEQCVLVLERMIERYGSRVWTRYGFIDAFHPQAAWYGPDVLGIDLGIMLLMAENMRTESVWKTVMSTPEAMNGFKAAGFYNPQAL
jgi:hypothetical protein